MDFSQLMKEAVREWDAVEHNTVPLIFVGAGTCGRAAGAMEVLKAFEEELRARSIQAQIIQVGCVGLCEIEPLVDIKNPGRARVCYANVTPALVPRLVEEHIVGGRVCTDLAIGTVSQPAAEGVPDLFEFEMLKPQVRRVLRNCGLIDPVNVYHYIARGGYQGIRKALEMGPEAVIEEVRRSGLRGRGGAGFPTWRKWRICRDAPGDERYLICNGSEGDPGAFVNRSLLEGDPHSVLEGMLIAGLAIGASKGFAYVNGEYPLAVQRLREAIAQMERYGFLGERIMGSEFSFSIALKEGAGAYVCGEETALIASIEGRRGMPRPRPPFPVVSGLADKPTVVNNVETLATIPQLITNGAEWFAEYGTEKSKGTKTLALAGKVKRTGVIEVPLGTKLREIIFSIGGGILNDKQFKAVQSGGPSGGCLPADKLDLPLDYEALAEAGPISVSGALIVMDEDTCPVDIAHYFMSFAQQESCGKCVPCRVGTQRMLELLDKIRLGRGTMDDLTLLESLAQAVKDTSLCGLGQSAPNPVLTTLRYFRDEYIEHITNKRCPAGVCMKREAAAPARNNAPLDKKPTEGS